MHQTVKKIPVKAGEPMSSTKNNAESELIVQDLVLGLLGEPSNFFGTTPVYSISHSFFLTIQNGEIVSSNPPIIKLDEEDGV